jgi:hypothetical protein
LAVKNSSSQRRGLNRQAAKEEKGRGSLHFLQNLAAWRLGGGNFLN